MLSDRQKKVNLFVMAFLLSMIKITGGQTCAQWSSYDNNVTFKISEGQLLECLNNIGQHMCMRSCQQDGQCTHIAFHKTQLQCIMLTGPNEVTSTVSDTDYNEYMTAAVREQKVMPCGAKSCNELDRCIQLSNAGPLCVTPRWRSCNESKYLMLSFNNTSEYQVTWSSVLGHFHEYLLHSTSGWGSATGSFTDWIQVIFKTVMMIKGIAIQKTFNSVHIVLQFQLWYINGNCDLWWPVLDGNGNQKKFPGAANDGSVRDIFLPDVIYARGIRLNPTNYYSHPILRFDVIGC